MQEAKPVEGARSLMDAMWDKIEAGDEMWLILSIVAEQVVQRRQERKSVKQELLSNPYTAVTPPEVRPVAEREAYWVFASPS